MKKTLLLLILGLFSQQVFATHIMGGEITYTLLDSNTRQYRIRLVMYRDCAGSNNTLNNNNIQVSVRNVCTNGVVNVTLTKVSGGANGIDRTALCPGASSNCTGGSIAGLSQYVFEGNYNFPTTCNEFFIFEQIQARNAATNNVVIAANNTWFYTDAYIKFIPNVFNSSARNDNLLLSANFCLNSKSRFSFYNPDINNDSLVYELVTPRQLNGALLTYTGTPPRDSANPTFNCGQQFNTATGVYKFVPNAVQNSLVAVKIKEFKNGVMVGYTIREAQFVVQNTAAGTCGDISLNNIKSNFCTTKFDSTVAIDNFGCYIDTAKQYDLVYCEGTTIDLDIKYLNKSKIPVNLNAYSGYGTMTDMDINKSDSIRDFKFNWVNPIFGIHNITLDVNNCPATGGGLRYSNSVTTTIRVLRSPKLSKDTLFYCVAGGAKNLRILTLDSGVTFTWNHKTGFTYPTSDTTNINIALTKDTTYIINYKYYGGNCAGCNNSDTLVVKYVPDFSFTSGPDSSSHCIYSSQQLTITPDGLFPPYTYKWSPYGSLKHPVTTAILDSAAAVYINNPIADPPAGLNKFYVSITANTGCELKDTFTVLVSDSIPNISALANKYQWCSCDTTQLSVVPGFGTCGVPTSPVTTPYSFITMGAGATNFPAAAQPNGYPCIFGNFGGPSVKHRIMYRNAELAAAGLTNKNIKDISFFVNSNPGVLFCKNVFVRMACTSLDTVTASVTPTQVYFKDSLPIPNAAGWITLPLSGNGYSISNSDNLIVEFCFTNPSNFWANPSMKNDLTSFHSVAYDSIGNCASTNWRSISRLRPQTRFNVAGSPVYTPNSYTWSPITGLSNPNIANPIANACMPVDYIVTATRGVCQGFDTIHLHADTSLKLTCRADTFMCSNLKVRLNATYSGIPLPGNTFTFLWRAINGDTSLRDTTIINPIVQPNKTVTYVLRMSGGSCTLFDTVVITRAPDMVLSMTKSDPTCILANGRAKVSVVVGVAPYTYTWNVPGTLDSLVGLTAGVYKVTVNASNGCVKNDSIALNTTFPIPVLAFNKSDVACFGGNNGAARVLVVSSHAGPFAYAWTPLQPNKDSITNLSAGWYKVTVRDTPTGCSKTDSILITAPTKLLVNADSTPAKCFGTASGGLTSIVSGGSPGYLYTWSDITIGNNPSAINKTAGNYSLTVTDAKGCKDSSSTIILQPAALSTIKTQTNIACNGGNNGRAKVTLSGGTKPYTYSWFKLPSPIPIAVNIDSILGQSVGTYIVAMVDSNGCGKSDTFVITQPTPLSGTLTIVRNSTCAGFNNGIAKLAGAGGTAPYTYLWSSGSSFNADTAFGLNKGANTVTVRDANLCQTVYPFNITEPDSIKTKDNIINQVSCNGGSDGKGWIQILSGGTPPFNFSWSPAKPNKDTITGLSAGMYYVTISDAAGLTCFTKDTLLITQPTPVVAAINNTIPVTCNGLATGSATASGSGGTPSYSYLWDNGATTATTNTLNAGNRKVIVTDSKGCKDSAFILITQPAVLDVTLNDTNATKCFGSKDGKAIVNVVGGNYPYNYNWAPAAADNDSIVDTLAAGIYKVIVTDAKGCKDTLSGIVIKQPDSLTLTITQTPALCFDSLSGKAKVMVIGGSPGYTYLWNTGATADSIFNRLAGNYSVTVKDINLCTKSAAIAITQPTAFSATKQTDSVTCFGLATGKAKINVNGNTLPYTYLWNDGTTKDSIANKTAGTYTVITTDSKGCKKFDTLNIYQPAVLDINIDTVKNITCFGFSNGYATTITTGGNPNYTYAWSGGGTNSSKNTLSPGLNTVTVTDRKGCKDSASVNITQPNKLTLSFVDTQGVNCWFDTLGIAIVSTTGGTYPYLYNWLPSSAQTDSIADNLRVGIHRCIVRDINNCVDTLKNILITSPDSMTFSFTLTPANCYDSLTAKAKISVTGGSGAKTYLWSTGATADSIFNRLAGNYSITVTDAFNCKQNKTITLNQPTIYSATKTVDSASCNGLGTGKARVTVSGNNPPYTYLWSDGTTKDSIVGKTAGQYTLITTDTKGCKKFDTVVIYQPSTLVANINTSINVKCFGDSTGSATAIVNGGNSPYTYLWNNGGGAAATKNNLWSGFHIVTVTDSKNCNDTAGIFIAQPNKLILTLVDTNSVLCRNDSNGVAIVATSGGTTPYLYNWAPSTTETDSIVNTLKPGTHRAIVTDINLCKDTLSGIVIANPDTISLTLTMTSVTCNGFATGKAKVIATGGTGGTYTYAWSPGGETTDSITGKIAGTYSVTVRDVNLCINTKSIAITEPSPLTRLSSSFDSASCFSNADGKAHIRITGGTRPYSFAWNTAPVQTDSNAINMKAGTYIVTTTDAKNCIKLDTIQVKEPAMLNAAASIDTVVSCANGSDGKIKVTVSGGNGTYTYNIGAEAVASNVFIGLSAGNYTVTVTDQKGCNDTATVTMTQPLPISNLIDKTNASCKESANGNAFVYNVAGGNGNYTYQWSNGQTGDTAKLVAGLNTYFVSIRDAKNCLKRDTIQVDTNYVLKFTTSADSATCYLKTDGSINVNHINGVAPYTYLWGSSPTQNTQKAINLVTGIYSVTITDKNGCTATLRDTVKQPAEIAINIQNAQPLCFKASNGLLISIASGGVGPYQYAWNTSPAQNTDTAFDLPSGNYTVSVTDSKGCLKTKNFFLEEPAQNLFVSLVEKRNLNCYQSNDGLIAIKAKGGFAPITYQWEPFLPAQTDTFITDLVANKVYKITITDAKGCKDTASYVLSQPDPLVFDAIDLYHVTCPEAADGRIKVNIKGGTASNLTPYRVSINDTLYSTNRIIPNLKGGIYKVYIQDANGCKKDTFVEILEPLKINFTVTPTDTTLVLTNSVNLETKVIDSAGNTPSNISYSWSPSTGLDCIDCSTVKATPYHTTNYTVQLKYNDYCIYTLNALVKIKLTDSIFAPTAFSPGNQDGNNDIYRIYGIGIERIDLLVFNRWGERVFRGDGSENGGWDGKTRGILNLPGVYTYTAKIYFINGDIKELSGGINLLR